MAKGNLFLGQAKGKVGSVVFSRAYGQQITRTKPASVANPKTIGQNTQRAILATIAKSAALLTPIVDHSFAYVTYGAESVRRFRKINMGILRNMILSSVGNNYNLSAKGANVVPNALKISEGTLPAFSSAYQNHIVTFYQNGALVSDNLVTVANFLQAYPFLQGGDQLTLVKIVKTAGSLVDGDAAFALKVDRMVFATNAFDDPNSQIIDDEGLIVETKLDLSKTTNTAMLTPQNGGGGIGLGAATDNDNTYAAALILSRKVNNVWQRSTQFLELTEFNDFTNNESAIDSYGESASINEATEYLNQADESSAASGVNGAYMAMSVKVGDDNPRQFNVNAGSVEDETLQGAANSLVKISAQAYAPTGKRVVSVEIDRPDGSYAAHGSTSLNYMVAITAETAGTWSVNAVFDDGTRARYQMTLAVQA